MSDDPYEELVPHVGHRLSLVPTGDDESDPDSVSIYCDTCNEITADFDRPD